MVVGSAAAAAAAPAEAKASDSAVTLVRWEGMAWIQESLTLRSNPPGEKWTSETSVLGGSPSKPARNSVVYECVMMM